MNAPTEEQALRTIVKQALQKQDIENRLAQVRACAERTAAKMKALVEEMAQGASLKYTGWAVLLKKTGDQWHSIAVIDLASVPDDVPEDFDVIMSIPEPQSMGEFTGF